MSGLLGKNVDGKTYTTEAAITDLNKVHGAGMDLVMQNLSESLKRIAVEGGTNVSGIINDTEVNDRGDVKYRWNGFDREGNKLTDSKKVKDDDGYLAGQREYYAQEAQIPRIQSLADMLTKKGDGSWGLATPIDQQGIKQFVTAFSSMTRGTKLNSRLLSGLNAMLAKDSSGNVTANFEDEAMKASFQTLIKALIKENREAGKALLGKIGTFADAIASGEGEIAKALQEVKRETKGGKKSAEEEEGEGETS